MSKLLEVLHQEDTLSPSALAIVKGGDGLAISCRKNSCKDNTGVCDVNKCVKNSLDCWENKCQGNRPPIIIVNPDPSCNIKYSN